MQRLFSLTIYLVCCCIIPEIIGQFTASISGQQYTAAERQFDKLRYNSSLVTWQEAVSACNRARNTSLLSITTETDVHFVHRLKQKFRSAIWLGDSMVFNATFIPPDDYTLKSTDKSVALQITSIQMTEKNYIVKYILTIQPNVGAGLWAMCVCKKASGSISLNVKSYRHTWAYYNNNNNCGTNCRLWTPPFRKLVPADFDTTVGEGNVTLGGVTSALSIGKLYWVNVVAKLAENPTRTGTGSIMECGYIDSYADNILFGPCNDQKGFICETDEGNAHDTTTRFDIGSETEHSEHNSNKAENDLQISNGLSTIGYAGIIGGVVIVVVISIGLIVAWKICSGNSESDAEIIKPTGGRSFMRNKASQGQGDGNGVDSQDENRMTMYAKIDPSRLLRNTLNLTTMHSGGKQPDIDLAEAGDGYLPMNGHATSALNETYDVIGKYRTAVDGDYDELSLNIYSVASMKEEPDSVYDTTMDRHPSKRKLIADDSYDTLDRSWSVSMNDNTCRSVKMKAENYSNHTQIKITNPSYDRVVIK